MILRFMMLFAALTFTCSPVVAEEKSTTSILLDHVAIYVRDLDSSAKFYKDLFGFREMKAPVPNARWLDMGHGVSLHIVSGRTEPPTNSKWDHIAVACADMGRMIADLDARNIAWTDIRGRHAAQTRPDGVQQIFVRDPDGYWIEINDSLKKP